MAKIISITGTITLTDHTTSEFSINTDGGWMQWAADKSRLGETADALDALTRALCEDNMLASSDDEDDEDPADDNRDVEECGECGEDIPTDEPSEINSHHAESCSLFGTDR